SSSMGSSQLGPAKIGPSARRARLHPAYHLRAHMRHGLAPVQEAPALTSCKTRDVSGPTNACGTSMLGSPDCRFPGSDRMPEDRVDRRLAAIFAGDIAGYSRLMGTDEEGTLRQLKAHRKELVDPKITEHRGRIVKTTGDGLLVEFVSVVDAVRC